MPDFSTTLAYLYDQLPMFQRVGVAAYKKDLVNTLRLCEALGQPQAQFKSIHIAGTNGKGSTAHSLAAILQVAGYSTGLYTSPHLKSFTERIRLNGLPISETEVVGFVEAYRPLIEEIKPSFFEVTVAMAFWAFARAGVDIAVVEVGMGGRLDSTNVLAPLVSVITNIGMDHQQFLGDTLEAIAGEKAGIIKEGTPVVVGHRQPETTPVFKRIANEKRAPLFFAEDGYSAEDLGDKGWRLFEKGELVVDGLRPALSASYQLQNLPGILQAAKLLQNNGFGRISWEGVAEALANMPSLTGLKGRWQELGRSPWTFCDVGHNEDGIRAVLRQIACFSYQKLYLVLGASADKDVKKMMSLWPKDAVFYLCQPKVPRALDVASLLDIAQDLKLEAVAFPSVDAAFTAAKKAAQPEDFVFVGGSTFVVAELV